MFGLLGLLGGVLGGGGKGQADERSNFNAFNQNQDLMRNQQFSTSQNALLQLLGLDERGTMDRAKLGLDAPGQRTRQAILGSLLQNVQPMRITNLPRGVKMGNISGGMSPALLNQGARGAGAELQRQALMALLTKSDVPAPTNYAERGMLKPPTLTPYQKPGKGESILSWLGLLGGGLKALEPQPVGTTPPYNGRP